MSDERWERVVSVTGRALELEGAARAAYLDETCGDDAELRRRVEHTPR